MREAKPAAHHAPAPQICRNLTMKITHHLAAVGLAIGLLHATLAAAGEGHDHGPAPAATGPALPRFTAGSDVFELVGVLSGKQITLYLDRAADNSPVTEAQIELEVGGKKYKAIKQGADEFEVLLAEVPKPGVLPVTATVSAAVSAGADTDLLVGELDIRGEALAGAPQAHVHSFKEKAGWVAGGLVLLTLMFMALRRAVRSRQLRVGGAV
jgi:hypothetical protein